MDELHAALNHTRRDCDGPVLARNGGVSAALPVTGLIERCWPAVTTLAVRLYRSGEVSHRDVCDALCLTDGGGPGSFELAMIRSGAAPGSFTVSMPGQRPGKVAAT